MLKVYFNSDTKVTPKYISFMVKDEDETIKIWLNELDYGASPNLAQHIALYHGLFWTQQSYQIGSLTVISDDALVLGQVFDGLDCDWDSKLWLQLNRKILEKFSIAYQQAIHRSENPLYQYTI